MLGWLFGRDLKSALNQTKKVRVKGIRFTIRKINVLKYLDGSEIMIQNYDTHKNEAAKKAMSERPVKLDKAIKHMSEVLVAGVINPKLSFKPEEGSICIDELLEDIAICDQLYGEIVAFTYGKKKAKQLISLGKSSSK